MRIITLPRLVSVLDRLFYFVLGLRSRSSLVLLLFLPTAAQAQFIYTTNAGGTNLTITGYSGVGGAVSIPTTINGLPVTAVATGAFYNKPSLTSVMIPDSVTSIGGYAFAACSNLMSIAVDTGNPNYSSDVAGVLFNKTLTTLIQCPGGKAGGYIIPNSVTNIGTYSFYYCTSLTGITFGDNATTIGGFAFQGCSSLSSVMIGSGVITIGGKAFRDCTNLKNVTIPDSVTSIGDSAFHSCSSLTNVVMGNGVNDIQGYVFSGCTSLKSVTIPNSVTSINSFAFRSCTSLTNVAMGNGVASIGNYAFSDCTSLQSVILPASVTLIGSLIFSGCISLTNITVDSTNPNYSSDVAGSLLNKTQTVLIRCPQGMIGSYIIPNTVTTIGDYAFQSCASLIGVTIPNNVNSVGSFAFFGCSNLTTVYFEGNAPTTGGNVFSNANSAVVYYLLGTTGWGATFAGRPTALWLPTMLAADATHGVQSNEFGFKITWAADQTIIVESSDTIAPAAWVSLQTNVTGTGFVDFADSGWTNYPARFYRIRSL